METIMELRVRINADRVAIFQFHNGQYFSSGNPIWRVSCTHETCGPGVAYRANEQRAIIASNILDLIMPLWGHKIEGVHQIDCTHCLICQKVVWECRTEELPAGPSKAILQAQGVDYSLRTVLTGGADYPIGYLVITCDRMPEDLPYDVKPMCDAAEILNYLLSQNGLKKIQEPSPEPSAYQDAYTPR
jgi:hypothetical protein